MFGKFLCFILRKHKRGKRINTGDVGGNPYVCYQCPRCLEKWARKAKTVAPNMPNSLYKAP